MWKALTDEDGTTPEQDYESACKDFDKVDDCGYDLWDDGTPESYLNFFKAENEKDNEMISPSSSARLTATAMTSSRP